METKRLKELVESIAKGIAAEYRLKSEYNTDLLAEMIKRRYWHPEEKTLIIADKAAKRMKKINKKGKQIIDATAARNLENLEAELEDSPRVTSEQGRGYLVKNIIKYEANNIMEKLTQFSD